MKIETGQEQEKKNRLKKWMKINKRISENKTKIIRIQIAVMIKKNVKKILKK